MVLKLRRPLVRRIWPMSVGGARTGGLSLESPPGSQKSDWRSLVAYEGQVLRSPVLTADDLRARLVAQAESADEEEE